MSDRLLVREVRSQLAEAGLSGSFLVRDLSTGEEIGIDADVEFPAASLVKVPLAVAVLDRVRRGLLDGATPIEVVPGRAGAMPAGPSGVSRFAHPARISLDDLLYLAVAVSDNTAADALFALVPPSEVTGALRALGVAGITVRHPMSDLDESPTERLGPDAVRLAQAFAIGGRTAGHGHPLPQLDLSRANSGSARAFVGLLAELWAPVRLPGGVAAKVRALMRQNVVRHRLAPDLASDSATWSSKTGTLLNLRHEIGVVEHEDGGRIAVAALTESAVPASAQPVAEAAMARAARALHDRLRER